MHVWGGDSQGHRHRWEFTLYQALKASLWAQVSCWAFTGTGAGFFLSKATATYPSELCRVLAGLHINAYAERIRFASEFSGPLDVPGYVGERGILRSGLVKLPLVGPLRDVWPESEAGCFFAFAAEAGVA